MKLLLLIGFFWMLTGIHFTIKVQDEYFETNRRTNGIKYATNHEPSPMRRSIELLVGAIAGPIMYLVFKIVKPKA